MEFFDNIEQRKISTGLLRRIGIGIKRYIFPPTGFGENLEDFDANRISRTARFVVGSAEGARFVPTDFKNEAELLADFDDLFNTEP